MPPARSAFGLNTGMRKSEDQARTGARLTTSGCLAGLLVALAIPLWIAGALLLDVLSR